MARGLSTLFAPVPAIVNTLNQAGFTGGIGTGPNQLAPPPPPKEGGVFALDLSADPGTVQFKYVPPAPKISDIGAALSVLGTMIGFGASFLAGPKLILQEHEKSLAEDAKLAANDDVILTALQPRPTQGGSAMAFQDGDSGFFGNMGFGDIFGGVNQVLQGGLGQSLLGIGTQALTGFVNQQFAPQPVGMTQTMAAVPAVVGAGRAVATVGRGFFNRFPNLATALQGLRNRGANVSRSSLYSAMRRFGPEMLVSGGILTAAAVSELAVAGPGRRRMNPGNVKALRRAHRRMKSFHHLCSENDILRSRSRRK